MKIILSIILMLQLTSCAFKESKVKTGELSKLALKNERIKKNTVQLDYRTGVKSSSSIIANDQLLMNSKDLIWDPAISGDSLDITLNTDLKTIEKPSLIRANLSDSSNNNSQTINVSIDSLIRTDSTEIKLHIQGMPFDRFLSQWNRNVNLEISFHKNSSEKLFSLSLVLKTPNAPTFGMNDNRYLRTIENFQLNDVSNLKAIDVYKIRNNESESIFVKLKTNLTGKKLIQLENSSYLENIKTVSQTNIGFDWRYNDCEPSHQKNTYLIGVDTQFVLAPMDARSDEIISILGHASSQTYELTPNEEKEFVLYELKTDIKYDTKPLGVCNTELKNIATRCQRLGCVGGYNAPQNCFHDDSFYCGAPWNTADRNDSRFCTQWNLEVSANELMPSQTSRVGVGYQVFDPENIVKVISLDSSDDENEIGGKVIFDNRMQASISGVVDFNQSVTTTYPLSCGF